MTGNRPANRHRSIEDCLSGGDAEALRLEIERLRRDGIQASEARKITSLIDRLHPAEQIVTHKVAFLRSFTLEPVIPFLEAHAALDGCRIVPWIGGFNAYGQDILQPASPLYDHQPDTIVVAVQTRDLVPALWHDFVTLTGDEVERQIELAASTFGGLLQALRERSSANIIVHSFERPARPSAGLVDAQRDDGQALSIARLNRMVRDLCAGERNLYWLDYDELQARHGRLRWHDEKKWTTVRMPFSVEALDAMAAEWWRHLTPLALRLSKVLVLDLDNTLWGGTIGEDGIDGIELGDKAPGAYFTEVQRAARDIARRGVLLAVASKNNEADALEALTGHADMLLRPEDFAALRINWLPKPENLADMAAELNLGLDSFVFFDDNPVERAAVRHAFPEVLVPELPDDPADYAACLRSIATLERFELTAEDAKRSRMYGDERSRSALKQSAGSIEDYLHSLEIAIEIAAVGPATLARAAQLTEKTNQLNTTTIRRSEAQLAELIEQDCWAAYVLKARDRFGDTGIVGLAVTHDTDGLLEIDSLLMSCRVIGRGIETAFLSYLAEAARAAGAGAIGGWFVPTAKNEPAAKIYADAGFVRADEREEASFWKFELHDASVAAPDWIVFETSESAPPRRRAGMGGS